MVMRKRIREQKRGEEKKEEEDSEEVFVLIWFWTLMKKQGLQTGGWPKTFLLYCIFFVRIKYFL